MKRTAMPEGAHQRTHENSRDRDSAKEAAREARGDVARDKPPTRSEGDNYRLSGDGVGRMGAAFMMPTMEMGLNMLEDMRELAQIGAEQIEENIRLLEDGWRELSACESAVDLSKAAGRFSYAVSKLAANTGQRVADLASESASRRMRVNAAWGSQVMNQARARQTH